MDRLDILEAMLEFEDILGSIKHSEELDEEGHPKWELVPFGSIIVFGEVLECLHSYLEEKSGN